jgi:hypothetical protein
VARQWGQESIIWNDPQNVIDHICINICVTVRRLPCDLDFSVGLRNLLQTHAQSQPLNSSAACIGTVFDSCVISVLMWTIAFCETIEDWDFVQTPRANDRQDKEMKCERKFHVVFVAPLKTHYASQISREPSKLSLKTSCMRRAVWLVSAGNRHGIVHLLAGSSTEVILLLFSRHLCHERTALFMFGHWR